jgi:hypothetical protein
VDANRFDDFLRSFTEPPTRRGVARAVIGIALAGPVAGLVGLSIGEAKKHKHKKKKKKCKAGTKKCGKTCIPSTDCCIDQDCPAGSGQTCQAGECRCPSGQFNSGGVCGTAPMCNEPQVPCDEGTCCSATCAPGEGGVDRCQHSTAGEPCVRDDYCEIGLQCVGFVCQPL